MSMIVPEVERRRPSGTVPDVGRTTSGTAAGDPGESGGSTRVRPPATLGPDVRRKTTGTGKPESVFLRSLVGYITIRRYHPAVALILAHQDARRRVAHGRKAIPT